MQAYNSPVFDMTAFNAVDSIYQGRIADDPWGDRLAGDFVDTFIYGDVARYLLPATDPDQPVAQLPQLFSLLNRYASDLVFEPIVFDARKPQEIDDDVAVSLVTHVAHWAAKHSELTRQWIALHESKTVRLPHNNRLPGTILCDWDRVAQRNPVPFDTAVATSQLTRDQFTYLFDVVMRYPTYGRLASMHGIYLNHPIRDSLHSSGLLDIKPLGDPQAQRFVPLSFSDWPEGWLRGATAVEVAKEMANLRRAVRDRGLHKVRHRLTRTEAREFLAKSNIPPELRDNVAGGLGAVTGEAISFAAGLNGIGGAAAGAAIGYAVDCLLDSSKKKIGAALGSYRWLKWSVHWKGLEP